MAATEGKHQSPEGKAQVVIVARKGLFAFSDLKRLLAELSLRNPWKDDDDLWTA